jgi:hypothetical protein
MAHAGLLVTVQPRTTSGRMILISFLRLRYVGPHDIVAIPSPAPEVRDRVLQSASTIPVAQMGTTDDGGFAPFSDDISTARDVVFAKIRSRVEGRELAADHLASEEGARRDDQLLMLDPIVGDLKQSKGQRRSLAVCCLFS